MSAGPFLTEMGCPHDVRLTLDIVAVVELAVGLLPNIRYNELFIALLVMFAGRDCGDLGYDLGYLRHGSFGRATAGWPGSRCAGLLDAMAGLARLWLALRWRRAVVPS